MHPVVPLMLMRACGGTLTCYHTAYMSSPSSSSPVSTLFERATAQHQAGDLATAERLYLEVLQREPQHFGAQHQLGMVKAQQGNVDAAIRHLTAAVAIDPQAAEAHAHLAHVRMTIGDTQAALAGYDRALILHPDYAEAWYSRGNALQVLQRHADAVSSYDRVLLLAPNRLEALTNRGNALHDLKQFDAALTDYDQALVLMPGLAMLHNNRGNTLRELQRPAEALASIDRALVLEPDYPDAWVNRGNVLQDLQRHTEALAEFDKVMTSNPHIATVHRLRADALHDLNRYPDAVAAYQRALQIDASDPETLCNYAIVLCDLARHEEALVCLDRALAVTPDDVKAINNRVQCLRALRRHEEAAQAIARLLVLAPDWDYATGDLFHSRAHCCDWTDYASRRDELLRAVAEGRKADAPLAFLAVTSSAAAQRVCAQTWVADKYPGLAPLWTGQPYAHDKVRVAYVSADFREHPVSYLMAGVFEHHDRRRFEVTGISLQNDDGSPASRRVRAALGNVVDVFAKTDAEIAALLRELEIDIAVDLMGHTFGGRTGIFARRPAPLQVNYLGFPGTMGASYMDYLIADRIVVPAAQQRHYTESIVRMPDCFQANDDQRRIAAHRPARKAAGLPESGFVFCCFNNSYKITPSLFARWLALLQSLPGSVLWLLAEHHAVTRNLRAEAQRQGVDPQRLVFAERLPYADHLARVQLADLFLDTLPFNAGTTASDALWAGVPVLTCCGEAFASRMAASLLTTMGLPELIAGNADDYSALALKLATTPALLKELRTRLSCHRGNSVLFDTARFCRNLESAYLTMWARCCCGEQAASFDVTSD
jgi:protein O-GlcNAc transferase